jgi:hypothetical protein
MADVCRRDVVTRRPVREGCCNAEEVADGFGRVGEDVAGAHRELPCCYARASETSRAMARSVRLFQGIESSPPMR